MSTLPAFPLRPDVRDRLDDIGTRFLADFLRREVERHPDNVPALAELAHVLTRMGLLEEGLRADEQLAALVPESATVHYNLACSLSLLGDAERALSELERAVELGYDDLDHLVADEDLARLRGETRFDAIVRALRGDEA